ncbi:MAG: hypothetical protein Q8L65_04180, partial [Burkholderiales bacterium]|nr:hypothetical protein [Burkholderiales bacterium]
KSPAAGRGSPGPFSEAAVSAPEAGLPSIRQAVRQEPHREHVPGQARQPAERSTSLRKRRS